FRPWGRLHPARIDAAALVPLAARIQGVVEIEQTVQKQARHHADGGDGDDGSQAGRADLLVAGQAATAVRVDDRGLAGHQAASLAFFLTLATARSRRRRDRWSMNRTPFRWSSSCWKQTA